MRLVLALLLAAAACAEAPAFEGPTSLRDFTDRLEALDCEFLVECGRYRSLDDCSRFIDYERELPLVEDAVENGRLTFDPLAATECLNRRAARGSCVPVRSDFLGDIWVIQNPAIRARQLGCTDAFVAESEPGDSCYSFIECAESGGGSNCTRGCDRSASCCGGTCTAAVPVGEGRPSPGEPCDDDGLCSEGSYCLDGTCVAPPRLGERCLPPEYAGNTCPAGSTCAGPVSDRRCRLNVRRLGAACVPDNCEPVGLYCGPEGVCETYLDEGASCAVAGSDQSRRCKVPLSCVEGVCRERARSCPDAPCRFGEDCIDGRCRAACADSDECNANQDCVDGVCETFVCTSEHEGRSTDR